MRYPKIEPDRRVTTAPPKRHMSIGFDSDDKPDAELAEQSEQSHIGNDSIGSDEQSAVINACLSLPPTK